MQKLVLRNPSFRYLEISFKEWLDVQGYAPSTVYNLPLHIRELLHYLETQGVSHIKNLNTDHLTTHYQNLKQRSNQTRGGGLSNAHLNKHLQVLKKFTQYLRKSTRLQIPELQIKAAQTEHKITYLTEEEMQLLFKATYAQTEAKKNGNAELMEVIKFRDRAMLAVFYGCGLRRSEGASLDVSDIDFDRKVLHVRKGKNNKERLVPISKTNLKYLTEYVYDYRPELLAGSRTSVRRTGGEALFITYHGKRMQGQSLYIRLKALQYHTQNTSLQEKEIGLHTLRHTIATHLLKAGMKLESISRFLGHSSLESTQIYTHLFPPSGGNAESLPTGEMSAGQRGLGKGGGLQPYNNNPTREITQLSEDE